MLLFKLFRKIIAVLLLINYTPQVYGQKGTLIEFGWDYPDVAQLSAHLPEMQNTPFDGLCFSFNREIMEAFDTARRSPSYYELNKLKKLKWGKYQSNFFILWGFGKTGGCWFNDIIWKTILNNMSDLSVALANPGIKGVLFDPEYYYANQQYNPWTYNKLQYPDLSYTEVRSQVKKRGIQFIKALQKNKSDLTFLSIWMTSLVAVEKGTTGLESSRHALLIPFLEGVLEGKKSTVKIIDGNEFGYWYSIPSQFLSARVSLRKTLIELMQSKKAKAAALEVGIAHPVFYDGIMGLAPDFEKGVSLKGKWKWLEENTKLAMAATDDITWFYSERINWWKGQVSDTLTQLLYSLKNKQRTAISSNKNASMSAKRTSAENVNTATGYFYFNEQKRPMETTLPAFNYSMDRATKKLAIEFLGKTPASLLIFVNNAPPISSTPASTKISVLLPAFKKGKIVILAKYANNSEAVAIKTYP